MVRGRPKTERGRRIALVIGALSLAPFLINLVTDAGPLVNDTWLTVLVCFIPGYTAFSCLIKASHSPADRLAWRVIGIGVGLGAIGAIGRFLFIDASDGRPVPAWIDPFFLAMYPFVLTGLMMVLHSRLRSYRYMAFFDTITGILLLCALCLVLFPNEIQNLTGHDDLATAVLLFFPFGDICLLALVGIILVCSGSLKEGPWLAFGAGIGLYALADLYFAFNLPTEGPTLALLTVLWLSCFLLMIYGTWRPEGEVTEMTPGVAQLALPLSYLCLIIGALIVDRSLDFRASAVIALTLAFVVAMTRLVLTAREYSLTSRMNEKQRIDELTRLPSRTQLESWLSDFCATPPSHRPPLTAVAIVIDRMPHYESSLGPTASDDIVSTAATRIRRSTSDIGRPATLDRGEFLLLCSEDSPPDLPSLAELIFEEFDRPIQVGGIRLKLSVTVGVSSAPGDTNDPSELPRLALISCQEARLNDSMLQTSPLEPDLGRESLELTDELRVAIAEAQLCLCFQPKVRTADATVNSVEALVRWQHPRHGLLSPGQFVPLAEESGIAPDLTDVVAEMASAQLRDWSDRGLDLRIAINLGMSNLLDDSLHDRLISILSEQMVQPAAMTLEVSEDLVMRRGDILIPNLWRLREAAFMISLDDFGSGTTSLSHLKSLPLDEMKIDRGLIGRMNEGHANTVIAEAAIEIGKGLGLNVVAEGAEDSGTVEKLIEGGKCDEIQSYYYAQPMPAVEFESWLDAFQTAPGIPT